MNLLKKILVSGILNLFVMSNLAMDPKKIDEETNIYHRIHPSVYIERLKAMSLLVSQNAQQKKFGSEDVVTDISEAFKSYVGNNEDNSENSSISLKAMNDTMCEKFSNYNRRIYGTRNLFGQKTIWIDEGYFQKQTKEVQNYLFACGSAETELMHPELKTMIISEAVVGITSFALFRKAKLVRNSMIEKGIKDPKVYSSFQSLLFFEDPTVLTAFSKKPKKYLRPGFFKSLGWGVAFSGPLLVLPNTSLEREILQGHKEDALDRASEKQTGFATLDFMLTSLNFQPSDDRVSLPDDELEFIEALVAKGRKKREHEHKRAHFNFYRCKEECRGKECDCKRFFLETKKSDSCTLLSTVCMQKCHEEVKKNPKTGLKIEMEK